MVTKDEMAQAYVNMVVAEMNKLNQEIVQRQEHLQQLQQHVDECNKVLNVPANVDQGEVAMPNPFMKKFDGQSE